MKEIITLKRFLTWLATIILEALISLLLKNKLEEMSTFIKDHFIELFLIVLVGSTCVYFTIWSVKWIIHNINYLFVKTKYYDIMINKMNTTDFSHPNIMDLEQLFTEKEKKYLRYYLTDREKLRIIQKGSSKVVGEFK